MSKFWTIYFINIIAQMLQICRNIKQARSLKGWSQDFVAQKIGVTRSTYKNWEENTEPDLSILRTLAALFGVPGQKLLEGVFDFGENNKSGPAEEPDLLARVQNELNIMKLSLDQISKDVSMIPDSYMPKDRRRTGDLSLDKKVRPVKGNKDNLSKKDI